jgi:hypothetical protein
MSYRTAWAAAVAVVAVVGVWTAALGWPADGVMFTFLPAALVGVCVAGSLLPDDRPRAGLLLRCGALTGTAVVAAGGLTDLLGPQVAAPLLVAMGLASPPSVRWIQRRFLPGGPMPQRVQDGSGSGAGTSAGDAVPVVRQSLAPHLMSDGELCDAWCSSYVLLQSAAGPEQRARVAAARQAYLDELERRHPEGLRRWLTFGARAASNPAGFLRGDLPRDDHSE